MRVRTLIIAAVCGLLGIAGSGCSMVLGLEDPTADFGDDDGGDDDVPPPGADHLTLNLTVVQIAQLQRVSLRVTAVYPDDSTQDATASATYESDAPGVAAVGTPGQLDGGTQAGTATITVRLGAAKPATVAVTVRSKMCAPVINEFQVAGAGASGASDEWVEILNPCTMAFTVNTWTIVYRADSTGPALSDAALLMTLTGQLDPGAMRLYAGQGFGGANDGKWSTGVGMGGAAGAIALRKGPRDMGPIADAVSYGSTVIATHPFTEGAPVPQMVNGRSAARRPFDGNDQDDGSTDFVLDDTPTPKAPNVP